MVLCEYCKKREGNLTYSKTANGQCVVLHLCPVCYEKMNSLGLDPFEVVKELIERDGTECNFCGTTVNDFKDTFYLGCSDCYKDMSEAVLGAIGRVQPGTKHVGKRPYRGDL
ncbi:MAG: hypothetical protein ACI4MT_04980 [Christensenellales bacterium]